MSTAARTNLSQLGEIVGAANFIQDPVQLAAYAVDGVIPSAAARPGTADEVAELVRFAATEKLAIIPTGARTKLSIGMPPRSYDLAIDLTRLDRILAYDPGDLTLGVETGLLLSKLAPILAEHRRFLPLAVPYYHRCTLGGTISAGVDSPLRQAYGTPRDYILGMEFVTGEGARTKSGGRVVKNVTGYDLHKLMIGALGTLGIITRINFRTFPLVAASRGFIASFAKLEDALAMRRRIAHSPLSPLTLEILSPELPKIYARTPLVEAVEAAPPPANWFGKDEWAFAAGFGGETKVLERYASELTRLSEESHTTGVRVLDDSERPLVWGRLRETLPILLRYSPAATILKISALPANFGTLIEQITRVADRYEFPRAIILRGCGVAYFALLPPARDENVLRRLALACAEILEACSNHDCLSVVPWCPLDLKRRLNIWGRPREDFLLTQKIKSVFDPRGIFAPGRFVGGL